MATPSHNERKPPPEDTNEPAIDVFSDAFFYEYEEFIEIARPKREAALKGMTVGDAHHKYVHSHPKGPQQGLIDFAELISARTSAIKAFWDPPNEPIEATLARMEFIDLTGNYEVERYRDKKEDLPIARSIWTTTTAKTNSTGERNRAFPLCLVLGPSGSGKTFFALKFTRDDFFNPEKKKVLTLYLQVSKTGIKFMRKDPSVAEQLISWIRESCKREAGKKEMPDTLDMHVCIVFDEAGSSHSKAWFEDRGMLTALCKGSQTFAKSVTVAVVGTGLTGRELSSTNDAYVFRMRPWEPEDLSKLLIEWETCLRLEGEETLDTVAHAIFAHRKLGALATNGRSAFFLAKAVGSLSTRYPRLSWDFQLNEWTEPIVTQVVDGYIFLNGINNLEITARRRVAASVFRAVHKLKAGDASLPTFPELDLREIPVAESLLQYNLESSVGTLQIIPDEVFAFTLTPAIALILYSMSGVYTSFLPGWQSEEELAAHYAVRQSIILCMERFVSDLDHGLDRQASQAKLDEALARIRLVRLQHKLESTHKNVRVPMVNGETILMNRDKASFADVIAPNTLIQAKHTKYPSDLFEVKLYQEMKKCGLAMEEHCDTRLLRGLIALWQNSFNGSNITTESPPTKKKVKVQRNPQCSKAFPENLLSLVPCNGFIRYAVIQGKGATAMTRDNGEPDVPLPVLNGIDITFILSTNAERLILDLGPSLPKVKITEANIDDDMEMDVKTMNDPDKATWKEFVEVRMLKGVHIKFLFTS